MTLDNNKEDIVTPWSSVGWLTYRRTYARTQEDGTLEDWPDTVNRVVDASKNLPVPLNEEDAEYLRDTMLKLKGTVAGRFLWQMGTKTVERLGLASLMNCAFTVVDNLEAFTWTFDNLMLGSGVGYNIQREYVYKLPPVREEFETPTRKDDASADFIVSDTREGWVKLLDYTIRAAFKPEDKHTFTYSTQLIRGKGAPIKGFGGVASGPEDLVWGIEQIGNVIEQRRGKQLRPIDCLDILNIIGKIVVAGNVRRSAQIAIGDADDLQFLRAKNWALGNVPSWRQMSNNSVVCNDINLLPDEIWNGYDGSGEPYGLINLKLSQNVGRIGDTKYKDPLVRGYNPCAEQSLNAWETCCLAEIFLPNIDSKEELFKVASTLYKVCKGALLLPCHQKATEEVVHKNLRMGIGVTGYMECTEEQKSWLSDVYLQLRELDNEYSKQHGINKSIKLTTQKPSGTLSLLPGVTPGCHPAYAKHMIRRIRIAADHDLSKTCRDHGYDIEYVRNFDGSEDRSTVVVSFPFRHSEHAVLARDMSAVDQLEVVRRLQKEWSDNSVSCTVYYKIEELPEIKEYLKKHWNKNFKTLSFLLHSDHGFDQAPLEEITKEEYDALVARTIPITSGAASLDFDPSLDCTTGACPIR